MKALGRLGEIPRADALVLPAALIVALVTQVPLVVTLVLSVLKWIVVRPDLGISFIGLGNYVQILTSPEFYSIVLNTVFLACVSIACCIVLGLAFAQMLDRRFPGVNIARTIMIAPFFVMDAAAGIIWKTLMLHPSFGINGLVASWFGVVPTDFLGRHSLLTIVMLVVWQYTPFFVLIILSGFESISEELLDNAKVDGAGAARTLFQIKIPSIATHIEVAIMLGLIFILKTFGLIYVTTAGGPGISSTTLPYIVYRTSFYRWDVGRATAMAIITVLLTLVSILALFRFVQRKTREVEP
jgi:sorbitol/mannitol transport system permease protein